jgi:tetratricopeptide (TPR) repeat protein
MSPTHTRRHLRDLTRAQLLQEHRPDRFRMHDLVRLYAAECARADETLDARLEAMRRLTDFYLHTAYAGDRLLYPQRPPITLDPPAAGCRPYAPREHTAAMDWFDTNHACILAIHRLAVQERQDAIVWQLAWSLTIFQWRRGQLQHHLTVWQAGLAAAERLGNRTAQAEAHRLVGHAYGQAGRHPEALDHLQRALALSEDVVDTFGTAHAHLLLAWITDALGGPQKALTHAKNALRLARILNDPVWVAIALEAIGWYHARLGNFDQAQSFCEESLVLHRECHHPEGEAAALQTLGYIAFHTGQSIKAQRFYLDALALRRDQGDTYSEATILERLGEAYEAYDQHDDAGRAWQHALRLYQSQLRMRKAMALEGKLGSLYSRTT